MERLWNGLRLQLGHIDGQSPFLSGGVYTNIIRLRTCTIRNMYLLACLPR